MHMLRTALRYDDGPVALRYPRGRGRRRARCPRGREPIAIGTGEILREGDARRTAGPAVALIGYGSGVGKALERRRAPRRRTASPSRSPTRASPSRSTPAWWPSWRPSTTCSSPSRRACSPVASARPSGRRSTRPARAAADPPRRAARPLRHPRRAGAPARGGRLHRASGSPSASPLSHRRPPRATAARSPPLAVEAEPPPAPSAWNRSSPGGGPAAPPSTTCPGTRLGDRSGRTDGGGPRPSGRRRRPRPGRRERAGRV